MVSRNVPTDRRKAINDRRPAPVGIAVIKEVEGVGLTCSCGGWTGWHARASVRETKAQRHLDKHHGGSGVWL